MFGDEPCGNYNRILLSSVLSRSHKPDDIFINPMSWYAARDITLHAGKRVERIDVRAKQVVAADGLAEQYDKLIIATGSSPVIPPLANVRDEHGTFKEGVFVFRTLDDCERIMRSAATARTRRGDRRRVAGTGGGARPSELGSRDARHPPDAAPDGGAARSAARRDVLRRQFEQMGLVHASRNADDRDAGKRACRGSRVRRWQRGSIAIWS